MMLSSLPARFFSTSAVKESTKVAVLGAAGGIGQPLSLLLKSSPLVDHLSLYDVVNTPGVAADLSHIPSKAKVTGHVGAENLGEALKGAKVVVIPAGVPRKPGMTRDDLFRVNAGIVKGLAEAAAEHCPDAHLLVISNPVNSTVPIVAEVLKKAGVYSPKRLFGVTTLDVLRARTFVAGKKDVDPTTLKVPVIGGHAGTTILPLLSQNSAGVTFSDEERDQLTHRIQFGGDEVVQAKAGTGSATLSMAQAGAEFTEALLAALNGSDGIVECAFVESPLTDAPFFASPIKLGREGVEEILELGQITPFEQKLLDELVPVLVKSAQAGVDFVNSSE
ncbi:malate dehydrogenase, NAD-dependent [Fonticula alba]|uniref:Malate dehydrogenase n=1 Tax=Fonticula alba TaxID=691883 RepID=A0A058Z1L7_FONAL|nr:malate dehydrogenase, NAD-dependent [Fonticula alba]KCV68155.1 malate dehydrogenase, NAD-dependent [Fonticula alba]|eukprot:XP_009497209.1 malate dehydrogenase, NAD-dependent [Fonticula alba]